MADTVTMTESATADAVRELLEGDEETARAYLAESFLTEAMLALFHARRDAHLTQEQVAKTMGTRQAAITRWERDFTGSISLRKYVEFALACGVAPFDMLLAPVSAMRDFAIAHPGGPLTVDAYNEWKGAQPPHADDAPQTGAEPVPSTNGGVAAPANLRERTHRDAGREPVIGVSKEKTAL